MSNKQESDPMMIHEYRKVVAQQIAAEIYERAYEDILNWEDYSELGEYDFEAIAEMVADNGPMGPSSYEYVQAWKGLVSNE